MNNRGFTIIEVLVSLVILSIIAVISTNILQSSIDTERQTSEHLNNIKELNLSSSILRRDIRQIVNITSRDFYGNQNYGTFIADKGSQGFTFNTRIKSLSNEVSPIKRVQYLLDETNLYRRQFFSSNPYDQEDFIESIIITNITDLSISFFHENKWHQMWPVSVKTSRKIPLLIKMKFKVNKKEFIWLIEPNIPHAL